MYMLCTSFVKFILKYFILFDAIINGITLILLSEHLSLFYRNAIDFLYILIYILVSLTSFLVTIVCVCLCVLFFKMVYITRPCHM